MFWQPGEGGQAGERERGGERGERERIWRGAADECGGDVSASVV